MPGPGSQHKKAKPKQIASVSSSGSLDTTTTAANARIKSALEDLANDDWMTAAQKLCKLCHLPDINRRQGLKKVYANFDTCYKRVEDLHTQYGDLPGVRPGIIGIYAMMCSDSLLKNKLLDKGFLKRLFPLIYSPSCQHVTLLALQAITSHGESSAVPFEASDYIQYTRPLVDILGMDPDDDTAEIIVCILSHSLIPVCDGKVEGGMLRPKHPELIRLLDTAKIIKAVTIATKKPTASSCLIYHAMDLLYGAALHAYKAFKVYPDATKMLVAGLSSQDWGKKSGCMLALIRLHSLEADEDKECLTPIRFAVTTSSFPQHIVDVLKKSGMARCDTHITQECSKDFQAALTKFEKDNDQCSFGVTIANNILKTEYSVSEGTPFFQAFMAGQFGMNTGSSFAMWSEGLPDAAKALRKRGSPQDLDMADILDIKYFIREGRHDRSVSLARRAIERNPKQAYWYYAISMGYDPIKGLKAAKQGLKCTQITPYVKYQLMQRAIEHAGLLGLEILQQMPQIGGQDWYEGIALLHSALDDASAYLAEAPPDNRNMKSILCWYILLTVTIKDLSPDLPELEPVIKQLALVDDLSHHLGIPPTFSKLRLTQETILKMYKEAVETFGDIVERSDTDCVGHNDDDPTSEQSEDKLTAWLGKTQLDDDGVDYNEVLRVQEQNKRGGMKVLSGDKLSLYRCGWCGNPSASLKQCSGCAKVKYCDVNCQKQAWSSHKKDCNPRAKARK